MMHLYVGLALVLAGTAIVVYFLCKGDNDES
jgi:hypothetical protein